jgi:hypothetical protein
MDNLTFRLIAAAVLHFPLVYLLFGSVYDGQPKHFYFPLQFTLFEFAASVSCIMVLIPILIRGDVVRRLVCVALLVLPLTILTLAVRSVVGLFSYAYD